MSYPSSPPSYTTKLDGPGNTIAAAHINVLQDELVALVTALLTGGLEHNLFPESTGDARTLGTSAKFWGLAYFKGLTLGATSEKTIAAGVITVTPGVFSVDTESDAASDDLDTLTAGSGLVENSIVILRAENVARVVTLKDGSGNLLLNGDYALSATDRTITLIYDGTNFREIARSVPTLQAMTLIGEASGTSTAAVATDVGAIAISGLTSKDSLLIEYVLDEVTQDVANTVLRNTTDSVSGASLTGGGVFGAGGTISGRGLLLPRQGSTTLIRTHVWGFGIATLEAVANATWVTDWTGSWSLAIRHGGVTAGGTFKYRWKVYKVAGQ